MSRRVAARDNSRYGAAATAAPVLTASARSRRRRVKVFSQVFFKKLARCGAELHGPKGVARTVVLGCRLGRRWTVPTGHQRPVFPYSKKGGRTSPSWGGTEPGPRPMRCAVSPAASGAVCQWQTPSTDRSGNVDQRRAGVALLFFHRLRRLRPWSAAPHPLLGCRPGKAPGLGKPACVVYLFHFFSFAATKIAPKSARSKRAQIQMGDSTHSQDQLILPVNFKTTKISVKTPTKPIPLFPAVFCPFIDTAPSFSTCPTEDCIHVSEKTYPRLFTPPGRYKTSNSPFPAHSTARGGPGPGRGLPPDAAPPGRRWRRFGASSGTGRPS